MNIILRKPWEFTLKSDGVRYVLEVVCGTVGVYIVEYELTKSEIASYKKEGEKYIESLVIEVQSR